MICLDVGIANVALPTMANQFSVSLAHIQWVVTTYLLTMVALLPIMGRLSDRYSRRTIYSYGFLVFSIGSLMVAVSSGLSGIVISRCVQGIGATMLLANSQAMVRQMFPDHERGRALGINAVIISIGTLSGPAIGGILLEYTGWATLFLMNVPFGIIAMVCGLRWFPKEQERAQIKIDWLGSSVLAIGTSLLLLAIVGSQQSGYSAMAVGQIILGCVLILALIAYERTIEHGIIDRVLYTNRTIAVGNGSAFLINLAQMATLIPLTFYMQEVLSYSTMKMGLILTLQPVLMGLISPLAGWYRDRYGAFIPTLMGALFCAISLLYVAFGSGISLSSIIVYLALFGIGMGLFHATNNAEIMSAAPASKISLIGSMLSLIRNLGLIIGIGLAALFVGEMGLNIQPQNMLISHISSLFLICSMCCLLVVGLGMVRPHLKPVRSNLLNNPNDNPYSKPYNNSFSNPNDNPNSNPNNNPNNNPK